VAGLGGAWGRMTNEFSLGAAGPGSARLGSAGLGMAGLGLARRGKAWGRMAKRKDSKQ